MDGYAHQLLGGDYSSFRGLRTCKLAFFHWNEPNAQFHPLPSEEHALEWLHPLGVRPGSNYTFDWTLNQVNRATVCPSQTLEPLGHR